MSAYTVGRRHIDFLVAAFLASDGLADVRGVGGPDALGGILWHGNYTSVNFRYREEEPTPPYAYTPLTLPNLTTAEGLAYAYKAVKGYRYQSCEHPGWHGCDVDVWTAALMDGFATALSAAGGNERSHPGGWDVPADYDHTTIVLTARLRAR